MSRAPNKKTTTMIWRGLLLAGAVTIGVACGDGLGGWLVSDQDEAEIGAGVDDSIEQEYAIVVESDPLAQWARELTQPLINSSQPFRDSTGFGGYKVEVIADNELVNAFAAPGGFTYLSTGLILEARTCAEIAGVMGHELAHVTERHGVQNLESQYGTAVITQLILGEGLASSVIQGIHGFLLNTTYSQEKESESDYVGIQIMYGAGYNPYGMVDFFERLLELSGGAEPPSFLSSHPATSERIEANAATIQELYGSNVVRNQTQTYNCIGTSMTLAEAQERIRSGQVQVRNGGVGGSGNLDALADAHANHDHHDTTAP